MGRYKCLFSFYGSKSKLVGRYPEPEHDLIIEPFAGGASYSLQNGENRQVRLNDLNPEVYRLWRFLVDTPNDEILEMVPTEVEKGQRFEGDDGLSLLLRANCNMGTFGTDGDHRQVTWFAAKNWHQVHGRLNQYLPIISNWMVTNKDYRDLENIEATWFIDPPYANDAGSRYEYDSDFVDYDELASWCRTRKGQVVVCENEGADWLPFKPLVKAHTRGGVKRAMEVIWTNE